MNNTLTEIPKDRALAFELISNERDAQIAKWGHQQHDPFVWLGILTEEVGELSQAMLHRRFGGPAASKIATELIQVAAVATQMIERLIVENRMQEVA